MGKSLRFAPNQPLGFLLCTAQLPSWAVPFCPTPTPDPYTPNPAPHPSHLLEVCQDTVVGGPPTCRVRLLLLQEDEA